MPTYPHRSLSYAERQTVLKSKNENVAQRAYVEVLWQLDRFLTWTDRRAR